MKLSKLSKEKRNQLVLVVLGTLAVLGGLGFGLVKLQYDKLRLLNAKTAAAEIQLKKMEDAVKRVDLVEKVFAQASQSLTEKESGLPTGDKYSWMYTHLRQFQKNYKVEIPQVSPISADVDVNLIPEFPYKQATMQIGGTACYHDLGQFLADFENAFPLVRVVNLTIDLNRSPAAGDREKLAFKMDLVTLVKSAKP
jgi:Tfp pilus assembly protein PilO